MNAEMTPMRPWRQLMAILLVFVGALIVVRGMHHAIAHDLGWQAIVTSLVTGVLVIVLGLSRWHYWRMG